MIWRWFDTRELRRALRLSEQARRDLAVDVAEARRERDEARALAAAMEAGRAEEQQRAGQLAHQVAALVTADRRAVIEAETFAAVSRLPVPPDHDRANLHRLAEENARLRARVEHCEKEHEAQVYAQYDGEAK